MALAVLSMTPQPITPASEPPMFADATGPGDLCGLCNHYGRQGTLKVILPAGIQACRTCDA